MSKVKANNNRMTIYVPTELKERMQNYNANWSKTCAQAIESKMKYLDESQANLEALKLKLTDDELETLRRHFTDD